jgi:hypothetical protein
MQSFTCGLTPKEIAEQLGAKLTDSGRLAMRRGLLRSIIVGEVYASGQGKATLRLETKHADLIAKASKLFAI